MSEDELREFLFKVLNQPGSQDNHIDAIVDQWVDDRYEFLESREVLSVEVDDEL